MDINKNSNETEYGQQQSEYPNLNASTETTKYS